MFFQLDFKNIKLHFWLALDLYCVKNALCSNLPFTKMGTWNLISGSLQSGDVYGRVENYDVCDCFYKKNRDLNLSPFQEIEPDQMKNVYN